MSKPTRYDFVASDTFLPREQGKWVLHSDHLAAVAEQEELKKRVEEENRKLKEENGRLNIRLTAVVDAHRNLINSHRSLAVRAEEAEAELKIASRLFTPGEMVSAKTDAHAKAFREGVEKCIGRLQYLHDCLPQTAQHSRDQLWNDITSLRSLLPTPEEEK